MLRVMLRIHLLSAISSSRCFWFTAICGCRIGFDLPFDRDLSARVLTVDRFLCYVGYPRGRIAQLVRAHR
jgi:hypothetical protein